MIKKTLVNEKVCGWHPVSVEGQVAVMFWDDLCVSNLHFPPKKDVVKGIKGPCKNKLQTQPWALSHSFSHSPTPFILRVPLDPAGAGPWQELWFVYSGYPSMSLIVVLNVDIKWFHVKISRSSAKPWGKEKNVWLLTSPYLGKESQGYILKSILGWVQKPDS